MVYKGKNWSRQALEKKFKRKKILTNLKIELHQKVQENEFYHIILKNITMKEII